MEKRSAEQAAAGERLDAAREERDRRADEHDAARGSGRELSARADLVAAEDRFAAREAWVKWTERDL
jgi:hypothetical protein